MKKAPEKADSFPNRLIRAGAAAALAASWLAIDPRCIDAFEAPKRVLVEIGLAVAGVGMAAAWRREARTPGQRLVARFFIAGAALAIVSCLLSPRRAASLDTLRVAAVLLLALPIGATEAFARSRRTLCLIFFGAAGINALLAILAALGVFNPVAVVTETERTGFGALLGNSGYLAIALALAASDAFARFWNRDGSRLFWGCAAALALAGILAAQSLTAIAAAAAGISVVLLLAAPRPGRALAAMAAAAGLAAALLPAVRGRVISTADALRRGDWNGALSARAVPWLAAGEMIRAHRLLGVGPGNFSSEFVAARLSSEARTGHRLVVAGLSTNSFSHAHNEYLQTAAEIGIPAAVCLMASLFLLLALSAARGRWKREVWPETAVLAAAAVAALTWFPFQIPAAALWIGFSAGSAFARLGEER